MPKNTSEELVLSEGVLCEHCALRTAIVSIAALENLFKEVIVALERLIYIDRLSTLERLHFAQSLHSLLDANSDGVQLCNCVQKRIAKRVTDDRFEQLDGPIPDLTLRRLRRCRKPL